MSAAAPELYTYHDGDEERVLAAIAAEPGISNAGLSEELGIAPDALKELTAVLRKERRAAFRSLPDEDGDLVVGWYPVPYEPGKLSAAPIPTPEPSREADELPESPIRPDKEGRTKCQYCGDEKETNVKRAGHERFCRQNPNRELAPGERKKATIRSKRSADDVRSCPVAGCPSKFKGVHSRKSLINHLVKLHDIDLADAKLIADGKHPVPSATEELLECDGDTCRIGPLREDLPLPRPAPGPCEPLNTCTPIDVQHVTIRTTERPQDEPTPLTRICALAVEMEALAARHGFALQVDIDTYVGTAPQMQARARRMGVSE